MNEPELGFEDWWAELVRLAPPHIYGKLGPGDQEAWKDYWRDGYKPQEALNEDLSYG